MTRSLKLLHLIGLVLFLGSIFGHIVSSILGGEPGGSAAFIAARRHILLASEVLTMPGLYLSIASGLGLVLLSPRRERWMAVHGGLGLAVLLLALTVVMPTVKDVLAAALAVAKGEGDAAGAAALYARESAVGGFNVVLSIIIMALALWRPRLGA